MIAATHGVEAYQSEAEAYQEGSHLIVRRCPEVLPLPAWRSILSVEVGCRQLRLIEDPGGLQKLQDLV